MMNKAVLFRTISAAFEIEAFHKVEETDSLIAVMFDANNPDEVLLRAVVVELKCKTITTSHR